MRKEFVIGICLVNAGVLCACLFGYDYFAAYGFLNAYHVKAFVETKLDFAALFSDIAWKRGELFLVIWMSTYTPIKKIAPLLLRCSLFFSAGMFAGACMVNMGAWGLVVFLVSLFPHGLFYLAAVMLLFARKPDTSCDRAERIGKRIAFVAAVLFLLFAGCAAEASAGTWMLRRLLQYCMEFYPQ